jgi:hypothetical protein
MRRLRIAFALFAVFFASHAQSQGVDLSKAPPSFVYQTSKVVPVDFETLHIDYSFDVSARTATARAELIFTLGSEAGFPIIDLVPVPTAIMLNGIPVDVADFPVIDAPTLVTKFRILKKNLLPNSTHKIEISYPLPTSLVTFSGSFVRVGFFMSDLANSGREFFEKYGPSNYEFDQVKTTFSASVTGTTAEHEVFTNGSVIGSSRNSWRIEFPEYFNTSAFYFHLGEKDRYAVTRYTFRGMQKDVPVTVYSSNSTLTAAGVNGSRNVLSELEATYGAYPHDSVTVYLTPTGGGMEYGGATMTSLDALGHELTHFYFARGVMPSSGNSGWIDESIASWRDDGYPRLTPAVRSPVNLGGFSPYKRNTSMDSYTLGARLIGELDGMFASFGGMRTILRDFFAQYKLTTINVQDFQSFLESKTGQNLSSMFSRYVFGRSVAVSSQIDFSEGNEISMLSSKPVNTHPRPYTVDELEMYR